MDTLESVHPELHSSLPNSCGPFQHRWRISEGVTFHPTLYHLLHNCLFNLLYPISCSSFDYSRISSISGHSLHQVSQHLKTLFYLQNYHFCSKFRRTTYESHSDQEVGKLEKFQKDDSRVASYSSNSLCCDALLLYTQQQPFSHLHIRFLHSTFLRFLFNRCHTRARKAR